MKSQLECSLVGTCLTHQDLLLVIKRAALIADDDIEGYDLHAYVVSHLAIDGPLPRAIHKLLDRRHEGILRIVGRTCDAAELSRIWQREYDAGRVPGAYWAFMTHGHIPADLAKRIFGEVHMLSHVLGRTTHATAERASELEARVADLDARLSRLRDRHDDVVKERDAAILQLRQTHVAPAVLQSCERPHRSSGVTSDGRGDKRNRALLVARQRARIAELRVAELERMNLRLAEECRRIGMRKNEHRSLEECPGASACRLELPVGEKPRILYLGGRTGGIDKLRAIAEQASAEFYHHDGGKEQAFRMIEDLVRRCHMVVCPIDCINHRACLLAKDKCKSLNKAFVPLRSTGGSEFRRALDQFLPA